MNKGRPLFDVLFEGSPMPAPEHDFPAKLRAAREKAGYSQAELARRAGVPQSCLSDWETGKGEPQLSGLLAVAKALRVRPARLL